MKKLLIGVLAVACCVAFSVPAMAEIKVGGMISAEQFYWNVSKERRQLGGIQDGVATTLDDYSSVEFAMGQPWNRLNMQYISDDKKIGGFIELRTGGQKGGGNSVNATANPTGEQNFDWELAYIDWHLNPNFYLRVGRQTQTFAIYSPEQQMGINQGHIVLSGFGNIHGATSRDAIRAYIKFNDMVRMEIQMLNPDADGLSTAPGTGGELLLATRRGAGAVAQPVLPTTPGGVAAEDTKIPRFDLSLPIKFGNFNIEPSFSWQKNTYTQIAAGSDDGYDSWGAALGFKAGFGPFTLSGEYTYGQNLGGGSYVGAGNGMPSTYFKNGVAGAVAIEDSTTHSAWLMGDFNFGPFGIQLIGGMEKASNDGNPALAKAADAAEFDVTRYAIGLQFPIYVAKNFKVVPQAWYYDYGNSAEVGGRNTDTDLGNETMVGVFWQLSF